MLNRRAFCQVASSISLFVSNKISAHAEVLPLEKSGIQVGVPGPDPSAFRNFLSSFGSMQASGGTYPYPSILNADQYPEGKLGATIFGSIPLPSNLRESDTLVFAWSGMAINVRGAMQLGRGAPGFIVTAGTNFVVGPTPFNLAMSGADGYLEFRFKAPLPNAVTLSFIATSTFSMMSRIILCRKADYASIVSATTAGQLLSDTYVNALRILAPKAIRTMGYVGPNNGNNFTQHRYRANWRTAFTYFSPRWIPDCWAGQSIGINKYTCAKARDTPIRYTMGEVLQLQFSSASTSMPLTIDVGARGDVPLFDMSGNPLGPNAIRANSLATLIFDDLLEGYLTAFNGLTGNVPLELQIALANEVETDLWYTFPPHITNSSASEIATMISETLRTGCYFEYANEIWNFAYGFPQTGWAGNCGAKLGFPKDNNRQFYGFYALRVVQIMPIVKSVWGKRSGIKCVLAFQGYGPAGTHGSTSLYRLQGFDLDRSLGYANYNHYINADYNTSPNRPVDVCDVLAYATYYSGAQCANFDPNYSHAGGAGLSTGGPAGWTTGLLGAADAYEKGDESNIANALAFIDWDIREGTNNGKSGGQTLLALKGGANNGTGIYSVWEAVARSYDGSRPQGRANLTVECYEGGLECSAPSKARCASLGIDQAYGGSAGKIDNLLRAYKSSPLFSATVKQQFDDFFANAHSKTASWFLMTGGNQWSLYPGDVYTMPWQSYNAVREYNL
jgi:hypothetical protein